MRFLGTDGTAAATMRTVQNGRDQCAWCIDAQSSACGAEFMQLPHMAQGAWSSVLVRCVQYSRAWSSCPWCSVRSCCRASSYLQSAVAIHTICIDVGVTQL